MTDITPFAIVKEWEELVIDGRDFKTLEARRNFLGKHLPSCIQNEAYSQREAKPYKFTVPEWEAISEKTGRQMDIIKKSLELFYTENPDKDAAKKLNDSFSIVISSNSIDINMDDKSMMSLKFIQLAACFTLGLISSYVIFYFSSGGNANVTQPSKASIKRIMMFDGAATDIDLSLAGLKERFHHEYYSYLLKNCKFTIFVNNEIDFECELIYWNKSEENPVKIIASLKGAGVLLYGNATIAYKGNDIDGEAHEWVGSMILNFNGTGTINGYWTSMHSDDDSSTSKKETQGKFAFGHIEFTRKK